MNQLEQSVGNGGDDHDNQDDPLPWLQFTAQTHDAEDCQHDDGDDYDHSRRFYARVRWPQLYFSSGIRQTETLPSRRGVPQPARGGHGPWNGFLTDDAIREGATMRSTSAVGCSVTNPSPFVPAWKTVIDFLDKHVK